MTTIPNAIYFDMDGTIADLYNVRDWLPMLKAENTTPYEQAAPIVDPQTLMPMLQTLRALGVTIGVISWGAIGCSANYTRRTRKAKIEWCERHFPNCFNEYHIVKYARRPKWQTATVRNDAILFDDDLHNCEQWRNGEAINVQNPADILDYLKNIIDLAA